MVNLKSSENDSTIGKMRTRGSVKSENLLEKGILKSPDRRKSPIGPGKQSGIPTRVTRKGQATSNKETIKTNKENVADKKKKVIESEHKSISGRRNKIDLADNKATPKKNHPEIVSQQQTSAQNSPTHELCRDFSTLQVDDNLKTKQIENQKKLNAAKRNLRWKSKSESELSIDDDVSEYFQLRRSERKESKYVVYEKQKDLESKIMGKVKDGLEVKNFEDKGRGIIATKEFCKGDFVIEYIGDLIDITTARQREFRYSRNKKLGCYMYYFNHKDIQWCIDATKESSELGRLINHSRKGNLISKIIEVKGMPHLVFFASAKIPVGTELLYDYGDRSRESVKYHPWLAL